MNDSRVVSPDLDVKTAQQFREVVDALPPDRVKTATADYAVEDDVRTVVCDAGRRRVWTQAPRAAENIGRILTFKRTDGGSATVLIQAARGDKLEEYESLELPTRNATVTIQAERAGHWRILNQHTD